jgi:hypothetical protein
VEDVKELLESSTVSLDLERDAGPGEHLIDVANVLNKDPRIVSKGAEIRNCSPAEVTVTVENIVPMTVDVKPKPEDAKGLPPVAFTPAKVTVSLPESTLRKARDEDRLYVYPNLKPFSDVLAQGGEHTLQNVALFPAFDDPTNAATISPATVTAKFNRSSDETTYRMPSMAVFAASPQLTRSDEVKAVPKEKTVDVLLIGPKDTINDIKNGTAAVSPHATFDVDFSGDPNAERTAQIYFFLPPGVKVSDADAKITIHYTLVSRSATSQ